MLPITSLSMVNPNDVEPGTLLVKCGHYERAPMFVFQFGENKFRFDLGPVGESTGGFAAVQMATNLNQYILAGEPSLLVDLESRISPTRSDIPFGAVALIGDVATYVIKLGYGTAYVRLDGTVLEDPRSYDNFVAFGNWKLIVPGEDDEPYTVYESCLVGTE